MLSLSGYVFLPEHVVGDEPGEDEEAEHVALLHAHQTKHDHEKYLCRQKNTKAASSGEYKSINPISSSAVSLSSVYTQHLLSSWEWIKTSRGMCAYFKITDQDVVVVVVGHITKYVSKYHQAITIPLVLEMFM